MLQTSLELILFVIFTEFLFSSSNYIHQDISGTLINNSGFNFSIYAVNLIGIILYGGDTRGNNLLIQIDQINNEKIINLKLNNLYKIEKIKTICECSQCSNVVMIFVMQLNDGQINITCNDKSNILQMQITNNQDAFLHYPTLKQQSNDKTETFIMMGNIGKYQDLKHVDFKPLISQLTGCLNKFYYDNKLINLSSNGTKFNSSCNEEYKEIICQDGNCTNRNVLYKFDDCSISSMNYKYCSNNLQIFIPNNNHSYYYKLQKNINEIFRINWKILKSNQYCLLEIELKNETFILFHINMNDQILMNIKYRQSIIDEKILTNISLTDINILLINFHYPNFIIKISNGYNIYTFVDKYIDHPISISVGMRKSFNICQPFFGFLEVNYDTKHWYSSSSHLSHMKNTGIANVIIVIVSLNLFIFCALVIYYGRTRFRNSYIQRPHVEEKYYQINEIKKITMPLHIELGDYYEDGEDYGCIQDS